MAGNSSRKSRQAKLNKMRDRFYSTVSEILELLHQLTDPPTPARSPSPAAEQLQEQAQPENANSGQDVLYSIQDEFVPLANENKYLLPQRDNSPPPEPSDEQDEGEESAEEKSNKAFCVMCETLCADWEKHLTKFHEDKGYEAVFFKGKRIIKLQGGSKKELEQCKSCSGVFYLHRLDKHPCGSFPGVTRITGYYGYDKSWDYCLMCQDFLSMQALFHRKLVHHDLENVYDKRLILNRRTLLPLLTDVNTDLQFCCKSCDLFSFRGRCKARCDTSRKLLEKKKNKKKRA